MIPAASLNDFTEAITKAARVTWSPVAWPEIDRYDGDGGLESFLSSLEAELDGYVAAGKLKRREDIYPYLARAYTAGQVKSWIEQDPPKDTEDWATWTAKLRKYFGMEEDEAFKLMELGSEKENWKRGESVTTTKYKMNDLKVNGNPWNDPSVKYFDLVIRVHEKLGHRFDGDSTGSTNLDDLSQQIKSGLDALDTKL
ncbi:hypothetical protein HK104_009463 [Borealophlyctis nickersoniae]|nr:hypothetical protein HK104_009463 [Borealophlyctis nickersoniae]